MARSLRFRCAQGKGKILKIIVRKLTLSNKNKNSNQSCNDILMAE